MRTNMYLSNDEPPTELLYKVLCRVNHACGNAANVMKVTIQGKCYVIAKRAIEAGEEILIDYIENQECDRLGMIKLKYNFRCQCPEH